MNKMEYDNLIAFHPGYYIKEIIDDMEITQDEFAKRLEVSGKTISNLISGKIPLSKDIALRLSIMMDISIDTWLELQKSYDKKILEIKKKKAIDEEVKIVKMIDYKYFVKLGLVEEVRNSCEKVKELCKYFKISSLNVLLKNDFLVNYRVGIGELKEKNIINSNAWLQTAINLGKNIDTDKFDCSKLNAYIPEIRSMTLQSTDVFLPRLREILNECGVAFVLLPNLKNSGINGAVRWINSDKVLLAINDRRNYADTFWFSLFHEIKHVLQQKIKLTMISNEKKVNLDSENEKLEKEADSFAQEILIPQEKYNNFIRVRNFSESSICKFSKEINIHSGIVVGRLQNDKHIYHNNFNQLKQKYKISIN